MTKFVDTNILLSHLDQLESEDFFLLSSVSLTELEDLKTNRNKTEEIKYQARNAVRFLNDNPDKYKVVVYAPNVEYATRVSLEDTPDNRIIRCAKYAKDVMGYQDLSFCSEDVLARLVAKEYFGLPLCEILCNKEDYSGYLEAHATEDQLNLIYSNPEYNQFNLITNQYLILRDNSNNIVDKFRWDGNHHEQIRVPTIKSNLYGSVKPYNGDIYQLLALDSMANNQVTMIKGPAGTGKSYLAVGYLSYLLEKHKIDRIVVFANPVPTAHSARIGFLPGTQNEKLMDSSTGNMLSCKLGDKYMLEQMANQGKLIILPMCDIRGFDTSGSIRTGVYITEAQNTDISLMKLAIQRIGEDSFCIIEGDYTTQVDLDSYDGNNNGMRRMSEVFRGEDFYGEVELQKIYRSRIAEIAQKM